MQFFWGYYYGLNKKKDLILIGEVIGLHGIKGCLKVYSFAESFDIYKKTENFYIKIPSISKIKAVIIFCIKPYKKGIRIFIKGINNRSDAKFLIRSKLYVNKNQLLPLENDTYYCSDLIGINVKTLRGESIGYLDYIISTGANDVYVIKNFRGDIDKEVLIPAISSVIIKVNLAENNMYVKLPDGLR